MHSTDGLKLLKISDEDHKRARTEFTKGRLETCPHLFIHLADFVKDDKIIVSQPARGVVLGILLAGNFESGVNGLNRDEVAGRHAQPAAREVSSVKRAGKVRNMYLFLLLQYLIMWLLLDHPLF